jgi:hypothetical protein
MRCVWGNGSSSRCQASRVRAAEASSVVSSSTPTSDAGLFAVHKHASNWWSSVLRALRISAIPSLSLAPVPGSPRAVQLSRPEPHRSPWARERRLGRGLCAGEHSGGRALDSRRFEAARRRGGAARHVAAAGVTAWPTGRLSGNGMAGLRVIQQVTSLPSCSPISDC